MIKRGIASAVVMVTMLAYAGGQERQPPPMTWDCATGTAVSSKPHSIKLTWDPSKSPSSNVKGYVIFRRECDRSCQTAGSTYVKLTSGLPIATTSCTDFNVQLGHVYAYKAQTVGPNATSGYSNEAIATAK